MAIYYESLCVDCGFSCLRESCPYFKVKRYSCDICGATEEYVNMAVANDDEAICEDCKHNMDMRNLQLFQERLYQWYVEDWIYLRRITKKDIDPETGVRKGLFKNQMYASMAEFLDNEYQDDDFLNTLCQHHGYKDLDEMIKDYDVEEVI